MYIIQVNNLSVFLMHAVSKMETFYLKIDMICLH